MDGPAAVDPFPFPLALPGTFPTQEPKRPGGFLFLVQAGRGEAREGEPVFCDFGEGHLLD